MAGEKAAYVGGSELPAGWSGRLVVGSRVEEDIGSSQGTSEQAESVEPFCDVEMPCHLPTAAMQVGLPRHR
ncbi:MAG: hypothetical protein INR71_03260 [Terriglobus roseus]|nr:hypothetical protein [Terriglobus roseus]